MKKKKTRIDKMNARIRNNPLMAVLILVGTLVITLSTFTNAAKDLLGLVKTETRANINGDWTAEVPYYWNNKTFNEQFSFKGEGNELLGTASLFRRKKSIAKGNVKKDKIEFLIRTQEILDDENKPREAVYRYAGTISDNQITFVFQKEGGYSTHNPIEFTAYRILSRSFD